MTLQLYPVPLTPGQGVPLATYRDPATGNVYQAVIEINPDLSVGAPSTPSAASFTSTGTVQNLPNVAFMKGVTIEALSSNAGSIWIGTANTVTVGSGGFELQPGASVTLAINNLDLLWSIGVGQLNYIGV